MRKLDFILQILIMTRHARNCTAGAVYTYHEKQKDTKKSGYGSQKIRLGKDSVKVSGIVKCFSCVIVA